MSDGKARKWGRLNIRCAGLYLGSNPTECRTLDRIEMQDDPRARRVFCRRYRNCVTYAAANNWQGFSCAECTVDDVLSGDAQRRDLDGLAKILMELDLGASRRR